jgi:golgin subfamily B member 1
MLLDELLSERERAETPPTPAPVLTVDPVVVPPTSDSSRRAVRQRLAELERAARRNFRSAEEARTVLAAEHQRLQQESTARTQAQHEAAALRREVERLSTKEANRAAQERRQAERAARSQIADELKRFQAEHERVVEEMTALRSSLSEHDGLLDDYVSRLRDEQMARAELRVELERAEAARSLVERSLERATENARHGAEDEMIRLATAEQDLADIRSDRDRLAARLADLTSGDGAIGRMTAQLEANDAEISRLGVRVADLSARIAASEEAAADAIAERDEAVATRTRAELHLDEAEQARADAERSFGAATTRISELEAAFAELVETTGARAREIDGTLGKLRRQARDASTARQAAEEELATAVAERDELRARVDDLSAEFVRARADGDRLRAHAALLGDELAATRATVAELQAAAPAPIADAAVPAVPEAGERSADDSSEESSGRSPVDAPPVAPPLPARVAGRRAPALPVTRRRPKREVAVAAAAPVPVAAPLPPPVEVEYHVGFFPEITQDDESEPESELAAATLEPETLEPETTTPVAEAPVRSGATGEAFRRTALAEFTALATSNGDDFSFRRRR